MTITIRPAVIADRNVLFDLNGFVQELHVSARPDHFKSISFFRTSRVVRIASGEADDAHLDRGARMEGPSAMSWPFYTKRKAIHRYTDPR